MKNWSWSVWGVLFFVLATMWWIPKDSEALPLFARKYGVQCTVCHVQFPKLNSFGIAFKNRGYRMHGEEGDFLWNSKIFPIAAIARVGYVFTNSDANGHTQTSAGVDSGVEIFSAGTLAPRISYFVDALTADNAPLVQFDDIIANSALNIKVGDFNVDNYYLSNPRRLTESTYLIQTTGAGMASGTAAAGSGARSDNVTFTNLGVELNGQFVDQGFRYILGIGNDNATGTQDQFGQMFYLILNQDIMMQHTISFFFRGDRIGASDDNLTPAAALATPDNTNNTYTVGGNIQFSFLQDELNIIVGVYQFFGGEFLNFVEAGRTSTNFNATSGVVEATYTVTEKLLALGRYDWHDTNDSTAFEEQWVASLQYHPVPNVKLNLEYVDFNSKAGGNLANAVNLNSETLRLNLRFGF